MEMFPAPNSLYPEGICQEQLLETIQASSNHRTTLVLL